MTDGTLNDAPGTMVETLSDFLDRHEAVRQDEAEKVRLAKRARKLLCIIRWMQVNYTTDRLSPSECAEPCLKELESIDAE